MSEDHRKQLQTQLWNNANILREKMGADEFRDYILGFIFYKYLSERMNISADEILKNDGIALRSSMKLARSALKSSQQCGRNPWGGRVFPYVFRPIPTCGEKGSRKTDNFILEDLTRILKHIESSNMGHESVDDSLIFVNEGSFLPG